MEKIPMTKRGFDLLQDELMHLKNVERQDVVKAIAAAREHGDLAENAEYHAAREKQGFIEGRISVLEDRIGRADVIEIKAGDSDRIKFGAHIFIVDEDTDEKLNYQIVGSDEADVKKGLLSITSPLARALINKKVEETVEVSTPRGHKAYTVERIEYI